jgi:hypothetical protein
MHVSEGVRHWVAGGYGDRSLADIVTRDIAALIAGHNQVFRLKEHADEGVGGGLAR